MAGRWEKLLVTLSPKNSDRSIGNLEVFRQQLDKRFGNARGGASFVDTRINGALDMMNDPRATAEFLSRLPGFVFFLKSAESIPGFGSLLGATMDVSTTGASVATDGFQSMAAQVPGVGPAVNVVVGIVVWPVLAMISLSRREFSQAIEEFLKVIPLGLGKAMSNAFAKSDRLASKVEGRWDEIVEQIRVAYARAKDSIRSAEASNPEVSQRVRSGVSAVRGAVGGRRKRLSTKKRRHYKWSKTRRARSARR